MLSETAFLNRIFFFLTSGPLRAINVLMSIENVQYRGGVSSVLQSYLIVTSPLSFGTSASQNTLKKGPPPHHDQNSLPGGKKC